MLDRISKYRLALLVSLLVITPAGYLVRFVGGGRAYWNDLLGAIAYEIFWVLLFLLIFPRTSVARVAIGVCLVTCAMEFLQLWQAPFLKAMQATFLGRMVLGSTFNWADFPSYFIGSFAGWLWGRSLPGRPGLK